MKLKTYLAVKKVSVTEFARLAGCARVVMSRIVNDRRLPSGRTLAGIEYASDGEVLASDFNYEEGTE